MYYDDKTESIPQIIRELNCKLAYKTNKTLRKHFNLNSNSHKDNDYNKTGDAN